MRLFVPTSVVARGDRVPVPLPRAERADLDAVRFQPIGRSDSLTWAESLLANYTDGILVLHRGRVVFERYFGVLAPERPHIAFSVTKSIVATLAMSLVAEGVLDEQATVARYVPALEKTGFGDATIRQVLDMTTGLNYSEVYTDLRSPVWEFYARRRRSPASGRLPGPRLFLRVSPDRREGGRAWRAFHLQDREHGRARVGGAPGYGAEV